MNDTERIILYERALYYLMMHSPKWDSNYRRFQLWDSEERLWWIDYIENAAKNDLPMAKEIVARAVALRMKS